ncbi:MAG: hypothetical protein AAF734_09960 [Bacteroidota bacterium]
MNEDRNIENFFKKRLAERKFSYQEDDWEKLAKQLDASEEKKPFSRLLYLTLFTLLIISSSFFLGWYFNDLTQENDIYFNTKTPFLTIEESTQKRINPSEDRSAEKSTTIPQESKEAAVLQEKATVVISVDSTQVTTQPMIVQANTPNAIPFTKEFNTESATSKALPSRTTLPSLFRIVPLQREIKSTSYDSIQPQTNTLGNTFSASFFIAPDFNSTELAELSSQLGSAIGVGVDYRIKNRFRVSTAFILNRKLYLASGQDYTPPSGFWANGNRPEEIDANCLVLDIPLMVGYNFFQNSRRYLWLNAGVSSYWFLTERYDYRYRYQDYNPDRVTSWEGSNQNQHPLSTLNVSILFESPVNQRLSVLIEPYYKAPLQEVGHGSVRLLNGGVNVGISYHFKRRSAPP